MSTSLQTTLAADAYLAEGQILLQEQTLNNAKSLIYRAGSRRQTISKTEGQNLKPITIIITGTTSLEADSKLSSEEDKHSWELTKF
jgi:hypothetical protein